MSRPMRADAATPTELYHWTVVLARTGTVVTGYASHAGCTARIADYAAQHDLSFSRILPVM